jgi:hypothetical protein
LTDIFVFGSNLSGIHSRGAALDAVKYHGAIRYQARGLQGSAYAIPTRGLHHYRFGKHTFDARTLDEIALDASEFIAFAADQLLEMRFNLTRVGCGNAGFSDAEMAPLFNGWSDNVVIPKEWELYASR